MVVVAEQKGARGWRGWRELGWWWWQGWSEAECEQGKKSRGKGRKAIEVRHV